jgi:ABC-type multidrug transport system ATPase subunit
LITVNGKPRNDNAFKRISAYVQQDDVMFTHLTVKETLTLSANFYLPKTLTRAEKDEMVEGIIAELGLSKAKDTIVGKPAYESVAGL